jgi:hypothetical protein
MLADLIWASGFIVASIAAIKMCIAAITLFYCLHVCSFYGPNAQKLCLVLRMDPPKPARNFFAMKYLA